MHLVSQHERARANGVAVGQYFGLAFLSPPLFWIVAVWGWRALFFTFGGIGVVYGLVWYLAYRDPEQSRSVNQAELDHIQVGGGLSPVEAPIVFVADDRQADGPAANTRRVDRPAAIDPGLLPDLVSDLPPPSGTWIG